MKKKRLIRIIGLLCLAINAVSVYFFFNRDSVGSFTRVVSYEKLYSPIHNTAADIQKWKQGLSQFPKDTLEEGRKLTATYAGVLDNDSIFTKIIKIGSWLRRSFNKCEIGKPTASFDKLPVLQQFQAASRAESPIWCGTFGSQFLFFCYANDIPVRYVESKAGPDNHVVNETFIPELNQWVFTDLTNNVLFCKGGNGKILNTVDLLYLNAKNDRSAITAFGQTGHDSMLVLPRKEYGKLWDKYLNSFHKLYFYYTTDLNHVYRPGSKIIRYIYPKTWFEIFSLTPVSNFAFYLRTLFLYSGLVLLIIFLLLVLNKNDRSKKYKEEFR